MARAAAISPPAMAAASEEATLALPRAVSAMVAAVSPQWLGGHFGVWVISQIRSTTIVGRRMIPIHPST